MANLRRFDKFTFNYSDVAGKYINRPASETKNNMDSRGEELKEHLNYMIDSLTSGSGANFIKSIDNDGAEKSIQSILSKLLYSDDVTSSDINSLKSTFNNLIINAGNSNSEIVAARVDNLTGENFSTIGKRIDNQSLQLSESKTNIYSKLDLQTIESIKLIEFYKKLMENQPVSIAYRKDSIGYGQDTTSVDKRAADTTPTDNGTIHTFTRASVTAFEELLNILNNQYGKQVTGRNMSYCGDGPKQNLIHYPNPSLKDLCIICFGINNATLSSLDDYNDVSSFIRNSEKIIQLELSNNTAVMIELPTKTRYPDSKTYRFTRALIKLAEKYGIPVLGLEDNMANFTFDCYSDGIHPNAKLYKRIASVEAIFLLSSFETKKVLNGTILLSRPTMDKCITNGGLDGLDRANTPYEINNKGIGTYLGVGKSITYYFETAEDNLIAIPMCFAYGVTSNVSYELDFLQTNQQKNHLLVNPLVDIEYSKTVALRHNIRNCYKNDGIIPTLYSYIPVKGFHSIKITAIDNPLYFEGLQFVNYSELFKYNARPVGYLDIKLYDSYSTTPNEVNETRFSEELLASIFNSNKIASDYFQAIPLKITITSVDKGLISYGFLQVATGEKMSSGGGMRFLGEIYRKEFISSPSLRTVESITFDNVTREYVIAWSGNKSALGKATITPM